MSLTNSELIRFLACPTCNSDLLEVEDQLRCTYCNKEYEIKEILPKAPNGVDVILYDVLARK